MNRAMARAAAMKLAYEWDMGGNGGEETLLGLIEVPADDGERGYIEECVSGVKERREDIDAYIEEYAAGWRIDRLNRVDLAILRLAIWELIDGRVPAGVVINEAVELSKIYSTDRSGSFINGVLGSVRRAREKA